MLNVNTDYKERNWKRNAALNELTLLFTRAGNWYSSPMKPACLIPGSCKGIRVSHSLSCAASSMMSSSIGIIFPGFLIGTSYNLKELQTVQIMHLVLDSRYS